jgi:hypothetical protein
MLIRNPVAHNQTSINEAGTAKFEDSPPEIRGLFLGKPRQNNVESTGFCGFTTQSFTKRSASQRKV